MGSVEARYAVIGEHFYQPSRRACHRRLANLASDPQQIDWNRRISDECYIPQTQRGTLNHVSFDFFATIRQEMTSIAPQEAVQLQEALRQRGVGDPYLHVLLPDLSNRDKLILLQAGRHSFWAEAGVEPQWLWLPETALDLDTLAMAKQVGYQGVVCAPEQIELDRPADNQPVWIETGTHGRMLVLPFDRPFSSSLAFASKANADEYTQQTIIPRLLQLPMSRPLVGWTDGETFGHHAKFADLFLHHLVTNSLPETGVAVLGINQLPEVWTAADYQEGLLRERTAWSCPHGDLARWHGACPCDGGHHGGWKAPFSRAMSELNRQVTTVLDAQLTAEWPAQLAAEFGRYFSLPGSLNADETLLAAKAAALGAQISCGTFFESPLTSGRINILFARQALEHLRDAGYQPLADQLTASLLAELATGYDTMTEETLATLFVDLFIEG